MPPSSDDAARLVSRLVRDIPDVPKPGIVFKDITPVLADAEGLAACVDLVAAPLRGLGADLIVGAEARGFLLGPAVARSIGAGFVLARKPGKLPARTLRAEYDLEYGSDALELHHDAVAAHHRVIVHDDLLATGGTAAAVCDLVRQAGGTVVAFSFLIELGFLPGRAALGAHPVYAALRYETEEVDAFPVFSGTGT